MQLVSIKVHGFKRFEEPGKLNVDGKLVAIVGPNEAGKTSLLQSMLHLEKVGHIIAEGPSQETTRGSSPDEDQIIVEGVYALDDEDRASVGEVLEGTEPRYLHCCKRLNSKVAQYRLEPRPKRSLTLRREVLSTLRKNEAEILNVLHDANSPLEDRDLFSESLRILASDNESLQPEEVTCLERLQQRLDNDADPYSLAALMRVFEELSELLEDERQPHAARRALDALKPRRPPFLLFTNDDRLKSSYNLRELFYDQRGKKFIDNPTLPKALSNLAKACDLDLARLCKAESTADSGQVVTLMLAANNKLTTLLESWSQSKLTIQLRFSSWKLDVTAGNGDAGFMHIAERSDGLRQFVAMIMFLSQHPATQSSPVLLIDEVERHLHYDAQADLVQMFARQQIASKVIYTTHSMGCLPEDLGRGVRMVEVNGDKSRLINWFWVAETPGFSPLLFGMGASTLAFVPIRNAVLVEGPSDMLLLPTMLRSATGRDYLDLQVSPGLAEASSAQISRLSGESPRTIFLVDRDEGGDKLLRQILERGISEEYVFKLPQLEGQDSVIEDFLRLETYVAAVNKELNRYYDGLEVTGPEIDRPNRPKALEEWCNANHIPPPSKRAVAYHLLDLQTEQGLLQESAVPLLRKLYEEMHAAVAQDLG